MPNHTVSGNVDTMMRAADNAAIRSAIGVGQTDAPTFLSVTISGDGRKFYLENGDLATGRFGSTYWKTGELVPMLLKASGALGWSSANSQPLLSGDTFLYRDGAAGILAQRNGTAKQALRVYNTALAGAPEWAEFDWITSGGTNTLRIGTNLSGTGAARPIEFVTGGVVRMAISGAGTVVFEANIGIDFSSNAKIASQAGGNLRLSNNSATDFGRLQLGGTTDAFPAIARDGAGIKFTGAATGLTSWIKVPAVAVSALPSAATAGVGARSFVNDALTPVFGSAVAGGGAVTVPVYSTGSAWNVG